MAQLLLEAAQNNVFEIAIPAFALAEPFSTVTRSVRDRRQMMSQLTRQIQQLSRSMSNKHEVSMMQSIPELVATIDEREIDGLIGTVDRILRVARQIELSSSAFHASAMYRHRFGLEPQDSIILATVLTDLESLGKSGPHVFANRNRKDFNHPAIIGELQALGCDAVWTFDEVRSRLGLT